MSEAIEKVKEAGARLRWRWDSLGEDRQKKIKLTAAGVIAGIALVVVVVTQVLPNAGRMLGGDKVADPQAFEDLAFIQTLSAHQLEQELTDRRVRLQRIIDEQGADSQWAEAARRSVERVEQALSKVRPTGETGG